MIELKKIDSYLNSLIEYLESIQNEDGSFDRMKFQPNSEKPEWTLHSKSASYDTAVPLLPLQFMNSRNIEDLTRKGIECIQRESLNNFLWTWPGPHPVPYCTDDTSMCSYLLEKNGIIVKNKEFINEFIDEKLYYYFFIWPKKKSKNIPWYVHLKLIKRNKRIRKSQHFALREIMLTDSEFSSTCVNLLYLNKNSKNQNVWEALYKRFVDRDINFIYYVDLFHAVYFYSRLCYYGNHKSLIPDSKTVNQYIFDLYHEIDENSDLPKNILLMNSILFFRLDLEKHDNLISQCINDIQSEKYKCSSIYYSSHIPTSSRPKESIYYTCYGSPAITCSLYIEFLNLYRKQIYGSYYSA